MRKFSHIARSRAEMWRTACFQSRSHTHSGPAALAGCRDCLPLWCLLGGLPKAKGIGRSCSLQAVAKSSCFSVIPTGPASITWHAFLMSILITHCLFLWWRLSSAWAQKGRWDVQESKDSCPVSWWVSLSWWTTPVFYKLYLLVRFS